LGFHERGFRSLGVFDHDPVAIANYHLNVEAPAHVLDLTRGIPNDRALQGVDVVVSGPPCQGFSTMGARRVDDPRNQLLTLSGILSLRMKPKVIAVENVTGAMAGAHALYWKSLLQLLRDNNYRVLDLSCKATDFGVAQIRRRILLIAWRSKKELTIPARPPGNSVLRDALKRITGLPNHNPAPLSRGSTLWRIAKHIKPGQRLSNVRRGSTSVHTWDVPEVFGQVTELERTVLEKVQALRRQDRRRTFGDADPVSVGRLKKALGFCPLKVIEALVFKDYLRRIGKYIDLSRTFNGRCKRLRWNAPSCAVDTKFGDPRFFLHPSEERGFTCREAARIQGFPDNFVFRGSESAQYRLIGNAVPPPIGSFVADIALHLL
jgi:DNA (cytosine-5)-methyltransferase 1